MFNLNYNDIGTTISFTLKDNNGDITSLIGATGYINFIPPNKVAFVRNLLLVDGGIDGKSKFISSSGDFNQEGYWHCYGDFITPSGRWSTNKVYFTVNKGV